MRSTRAQVYVPWKGICFLGLLVAIAALMVPHSNWGPIDEGEIYYRSLESTWSDVFSQVFQIQKPRMPIFGTARPFALRFYFKLLSIFDLGRVRLYLVQWPLAWLSTVCFAGGLLKLFSVGGKKFHSSALWILSLTLWSTPVYLFCVRSIYPDNWLQQGLVGLSWVLILSAAHFESRLLEFIKISAGVLLAFLSCQCHESAVFMLLWSSVVGALLKFGIRRFSTRRVKKKSGDSNHVSWQRIAIPGLVAVFYVAVFRGLDFSGTNRVDILLSLDPVDLLKMLPYYFTVSFNWFSSTAIQVFDLKQHYVGIDPYSTNIFGALTLSGVCAIGNQFLTSDIEKTKRHERVSISVFIGLGFLALALPYCIMQNRAHIHYSVRCQLMVSTFVGVAAAWWIARDGKIPRKVLLAWGLCLLGNVLATYSLFNNKNYVKEYGGWAKRFGVELTSLPSIAVCTSDNPCCVKIINPFDEWLFTVDNLNWVDHASNHPRFVAPGKPCENTMELKIKNPYSGGWK